MSNLDFDKKIGEGEFVGVYPHYYAVIPAEVRYAKISMEAKFLYGEVTSLSNTDGHSVQDIRYYAFLYGVTPRKIVGWLKELKDKKLISCKILSCGTVEVRI